MAIIDRNLSAATGHICRLLEDHLWSYRQECRALPHAAYVPWPEDIYTGEWGTYVVKWQGAVQDAPLAPYARCMMDLAGNLVVNAGYSRLGPHTEIHPHEGYTSDVIRCHLPLVVPEGDVGLQVGDDVIRPVPGSVYLFDDTQTHSAWNRTDAQRIVLILDLARSVVAMHGPYEG